MEVAAVTFADGEDNIGVYVPVVATAGVGGMSVYAVVFLTLVAVWCFAGRFFAIRSVVAKALRRWGHILLPSGSVVWITPQTRGPSSASLCCDLIQTTDPRHQRDSAICLARVRPVSTGFTEPTVGNSDWSHTKALLT